MELLGDVGQMEVCHDRFDKLEIISIISIFAFEV
jgi:hypothetical protein